MEKEFGAKHLGKVFILYQKAGDMVTVPPGWIHYVRNERDCVKLAYDYFVPENFPLYIRVWRDVIAPYFEAAQDYMAAQDVLLAWVQLTLMRLGADRLRAGPA